LSVMKVNDKEDVKRTAEQPAVRTTIVGGRPPGPGKGVGAVPRGIEVLVKKAAVDEEFKALLLAERSAAADAIRLELSGTETAMLDSVPIAQLEAIIANTTVSPKIKPAFMGRAAAVMLAALGASTYAYSEVENDSSDLSIFNKAPFTKNADDSGNTVDFSEEKVEPNTTTGIIKGFVKSETGLPLEGALIVIKGNGYRDKTVSDENGYYFFESVPVGYYDVKASRRGYSEMSAIGVKVVEGLIANVGLTLFAEISTGIRPDIPPEKGE
jgi:hypothetical protein